VDIGFNPIKKIYPIRDVPNLRVISWLDPKFFTEKDIKEINQQLETEGLELYEQERSPCASEGTPYYYFNIGPKV